MAKINCWEFKKCGREPGGAKISELGVCPAALSGEGDSVNGGHHRGRICWAVSGTFCKGQVQGTFAKKKATCLACDFLTKVRDEEGSSFCLLMPHQTNK